MKNTPQTNELNVLQHGISVWKYYRKIIDGATHNMKLPPWFLENRDKLLSNIHERNMIRTYTIMHDLGKTQCIMYDENGKRHFPNHAEVSQTIWNNEVQGNPIIGQLIGLDMIFHTETAEEILARNLDQKTLNTLMISALAELHANAEMFGGINSESFCIKYKRLNNRAKRILK